MIRTKNIWILSLDLQSAFYTSFVYPQITSLIFWDSKHFTRTIPSYHSVTETGWLISAGASLHLKHMQTLLPSSWRKTRSEIFSVSIRQLFFMRKDCTFKMFYMICMNFHICIYVNINWYQYYYWIFVTKSFWTCTSINKNLSMNPNMCMPIYKLCLSTTVLI